MNLGPFRRRALLGALLLALPVFAEDVSRLQQVTDELATLQTVIEKLPDGRDRKKLEDRRSLLERERDILRQRQLLEAKEQAVDRRLQESPALKLQGELRMLEPHTRPLQTRMDTLNDQLRDSTARNELLRTNRTRTAKLPASSDRDSRLALLNEQLLTANEETEALQLQREAVSLGLALAREMESISARLREEPATPPRNLRVWWERQHEIAELTGHLASVSETARNVEDRRTAAGDSLALAKEKLAQIDDEIALLAPQTGLFRSTAGVDRLLAAARREKEALAARLPFVESQLAALTEAAATAAQTEDLVATQASWLRERQQLLTSRYLRWLAWPVSAIILVIALFSVSSYAILPRVYKREMLVSARRVNRYFFVAALATVVAGFFFDDLRVLATTLGIVSAALVIALQDVFTSIAGWFAIVISHKVRVGDRVEIDGIKGDVLEIELMRTTLNEIDAGLGMDHATGRIVALPNNFIFKSRVHNTTHLHRWVWLRTDIMVTYETPMAEAMTVLRKVLEEETAETFAEARKESAAAENRYGRPDAVYEPKIYCTIADSGVTFSLVTVADYRAKTAMRDRLHWRILAEFARNPQLQFAYPTRREILSRDLSNRPPTADSRPATPSRLTAWPGSAN